MRAKLSLSWRSESVTEPLTRPSARQQGDGQPASLANIPKWSPRIASRPLCFASQSLPRGAAGKGQWAGIPDRTTLRSVGAISCAAPHQCAGHVNETGRRDGNERQRPTGINGGKADAGVE
jgi:hypothetical protein